ncbi:transcriptional regulator [Candidatus Poriferisodalis sp.]|uniref:transcriptional regulator n=1 Tax=Candidatus Poriferisodalis sp. TaxID=3101277 RepID=UPI003B52F1B0
MPLTRDFKETVQARVQRDPEFRQSLFQEGIECMLAGDVDTANSLLRTYINATMGFSELGKLTNKQPKSLMRMLGPQGNPNARNFFDIIGCIQRHEGIQLAVTLRGAAQAPTPSAD